MSFDFSLLTHIQLKKKKRHQGHWRSSRACTSLKQEERSSIAFPPCFLLPQFNWATAVNSEEIWEMWVTTRPGRATELGVGSEVSGCCLISSRFGLIKISHPLIYGTQYSPNHLHHSLFLTINQTASLKSSGSWGFAAGIKSLLLTTWQAWP